MTTTEQRVMPAPEGHEVRVVTPDGGTPKVRGYGVVYNSRSSILYTGMGQPFRETVKPGAAARSLVEADLTVDMHHNPEKILGRKSAGTARFGDDSTGVWYEADLPDTSYARDLQVSLARRDITGSSFVFSTIDDDWDGPDDQGVYDRTLNAIHVFNMGPVDMPAYPATTAALRSAGPDDAAGRSLAAWLEKRNAAKADEAPEPEPAAPEPPAEPATSAGPTPEQIKARQRLTLARLRS